MKIFLMLVAVFFGGGSALAESWRGNPHQVTVNPNDPRYSVRVVIPFHVGNQNGCGHGLCGSRPRRHRMSMCNRPHQHHAGCRGHAHGSMMRPRSRHPIAVRGAETPPPPECPGELRRDVNPQTGREAWVCRVRH